MGEVTRKHEWLITGDFTYLKFHKIDLDWLALYEHHRYEFVLKYGNYLSESFDFMATLHIWN